MDFKNQEDKQEDKIIVQCVVCGRVRRKITDWSEEIREPDPCISKVICPHHSPRPEEK